MTIPTPIFYGLLYIDKGKRQAPNLATADDPFDVYLRCASLCAKSIGYHGYEFRLVTNDRPRVERRLHELDARHMNVVEHEFSLDVPDGIRATHFKLELLKLLGSGSYGDHVGVVDVDCVMINSIDFPPLEPGTMLVYDITDHVLGEFGSGVVRSSLECIRGQKVLECRWFGSEFMFGHAASFRRLSLSVSQLWPNYIHHIENLHHVGDEMLVASAVPSSNLKLMDGGQLGLVARWWTARTNFKQMPLEAVVKRSVLHLPSDKEFLSDVSDSEFFPAGFLKTFKQAARWKLLQRRLLNTAGGLVSRRRKYVARLS